MVIHPEGRVDLLKYLKLQQLKLKKLKVEMSGPDYALLLSRGVGLGLDYEGEGGKKMPKD